MIAVIEGTVLEKGRGNLVLMAGGIGWLLNCSMNTLQAAPAVGETMRCHTFLSVREDAMELFGFSTQEEKRMFMSLTGVSGVGPRTALGVLGTLSVRDLSMAIAMDDVTAISRAPGVGKKTAQRIVMELKEKVAPGDMTASAVPGQAASTTGDPVAEAMEALTVLGYTGQEARDALMRVRNQSQNTEELIRLALRSMAGA